RKLDAENGATPRLVGDLELRVVGLRNRGADREAEPGTALLRREERFEDTVEQLGRHAGPRVDDGHARVRLGHSHLDPERAAWRRGRSWAKVLIATSGFLISCAMPEASISK